MGQAMNKLDAGPPLYVRNDIRSQSNARDHDMDCNEVKGSIYIWCIVGGWCCHILKFERYKAKKLNCYVNVVLNVHEIECTACANGAICAPIIS